MLAGQRTKGVNKKKGMRKVNENNICPSFSPADLEQALSHESVGKKTFAGLDTQCSIHIHSKRRRLADPDGISGKYLIDGFVNTKLLRDDSAKQIKQVTFSQEKISKGDEEKTIVIIEW